MSTENAKEEFLEHTGSYVVKCALLRTDKYDDEYNEVETFYRLKEGFTLEDLKVFYKSIDFSYDSGYGGQNLFGKIWYQDGTYSSRGEYDGSEWWEHHITPAIPEELNQT